jgi:hypothetical protein
MKEKFIVKIPIHPLQENTEYKELRCKTHKEIAEFLQVSQNTIKSIMSGNLKFILPKTHHLKGIKIERIIEPHEIHEPKEILSEEDKREKTIQYQQGLLEKLNNIK